MKRYAYARIDEVDLIDHLRKDESIPYEHFIFVKEDGLDTEGLADSETSGYSWSALDESVRRLMHSHSATLVVPQATIVVGDGKLYTQRTYHYKGLVSDCIVSFENPARKTNRGSGIILTSSLSSTAATAEMLRAYGLAFPQRSFHKV